MKTRVLFVGGYGNGRRSMERVEEGFEGFGIDDMQAVTYSKMVSDPLKMARLVREATLVGTHSAGAEVVCHGEVPPNCLVAYNPPIPRRRHQLVIAAFRATGNMLSDGMHDKDKLWRAVELAGSYALENAIHPIANFGKFVDGTIPNFDARIVLPEIAEITGEGSVTYVHTESDEYFSPTTADLDRIGNGGVKVMCLPGGHARFLLEPNAVLRESNIKGMLERAVILMDRSSNR